MSTPPAWPHRKGDVPENKEMPQKEVGIQIGSLPLFGAGLGEGIKLENYHIYLVSQDFEFGRFAE